MKTERLKSISKQIAKTITTEKEADVGKTIIWIELNIGLTKTRAFEYIKTCAEAHDWEVADGKIRPATM